jgi:hypothetical protein
VPEKTGVADETGMPGEAGVAEKAGAPGKAGVSDEVSVANVDGRGLANPIGLETPIGCS